jgi:galactokinase
MEKDRIKNIRIKFDKFFKANSGKTRLFFAPGGVNLIGEHTDYNGGFVFPCAIDKTILVAAAPRTDGKIGLASLNFNTKVECGLDDIAYNEKHGWANYPKGVIKTLQDAGYTVKGMNLLFDGNVPVASGLSSSAAMEVATAVTASYMSGFKLDKKKMALLCQKAENEFIGVKCGIMDQFVIAFGKKDHAVFLDCKNLSYQLVPLKLKGVSIVIGNTKVKRKLSGSEYNTRRQECEKGAKLLSRYKKNIKLLRDVPAALFEKHKNELPDNVRKRCEHIIYEDERCGKAAKLLKKNDIAGFGRLMIEAHASIRDLFEVSCRELDIMVEEALKIKGTLGSRMTGAGFGGCTVSLVKNSSVKEFIRTVGRNYKKSTGITPEFYVSTPHDGAGTI